MPGRNAVFRLLPWNSLRCVGLSLLYSVCKGKVWNIGLPTVQRYRTEAGALGGLELVVLCLQDVPINQNTEGFHELPGSLNEMIHTDPAPNNTKLST